MADAAIDTVDTEDPPGTQLSTPKQVRGEIRREVRQFERGPSSQPADASAPGQKSEPSPTGETPGEKGNREQPGGQERRAGAIGQSQQASPPPVINPLFAALSIPTHQASPETQWEISRAAAETWLSAMDPHRRQSLWNQWGQSQMHSRMMAKIIETMAGEPPQAGR